VTRLRQCPLYGIRVQQ